MIDKSLQMPYNLAMSAENTNELAARAHNAAYKIASSFLLLGSIPGQLEVTAEGGLFLAKHPLIVDFMVTSTDDPQSIRGSASYKGERVADFDLPTSHRLRRSLEQIAEGGQIEQPFPLPTPDQEGTEILRRASVEKITDAAEELLEIKGLMGITFPFYSG